MKHLIYLGTPGIGENIQMIPALREWTGREGMCNAVAVFPSAQAESEIFADMPADWYPMGHPLSWKRDGTVTLDSELMSALKAEIGPGYDDVEIRSRQNIDVECELPTGWHVESRFPSPGHWSVPEGNGVLINGCVPKSTLFNLGCKQFPVHMDVILCSGSNEPMRMLPPSSFVHLAQALADKLHGGMVPIKPEHRKLGLFFANDRYPAALDAMWPDWKKHVRKARMDRRTPETLSDTHLLINSSFVCISPDTGTAHLSLAAAMNPALSHHLILLPTRENEQMVFSTEQMPFYWSWRKTDSHCDHKCRGYMGAATVPKNYPWSLQCSRAGSVPCLMLNDNDITEITGMALKRLSQLKAK